MKKRKLKKDRKKSWEIWQNHHLSYNPEITTRITRMEHWFARNLQRSGMKRGLSRGMHKVFRYLMKICPINYEHKRNR